MCRCCTARTAFLTKYRRRWSDDQLKSNFHRVRPPRPGEYLGPRYTIAFFAQANRDVLIDPPGGSYEAITAGDYLTQRIAANFAK